MKSSTSPGSIYPKAKIPPPGEIGKAPSCIHCQRKILVPKWDDWNGFLVECPYCRLFHGKKWNKKAILWSSFFLQPLSFFFTARPLKAFCLVIGYAVMASVLIYILDKEFLPSWLSMSLGGIFLFIPMILNAFFIIVHESKLNLSNKTRQNNLTSLSEQIISLLSS